MKILLGFLLISFYSFGFQTSAKKNDFSSKDQSKLTKAGLKVNYAGRKYLESYKTIKKGKKYRLVMECIAGSRRKCKPISLDKDL